MIVCCGWCNLVSGICPLSSIPDRRWMCVKVGGASYVGSAEERSGEVNSCWWSHCLYSSPPFHLAMKRDFISEMCSVQNTR